MPNHVQSTLKFKGKNKEVEEILEFIKKNEKRKFSFEKIIPIPPHILRGNLGAKEIEICGKDNWYDWCCSNWGTKWDAFGVVVEIKKTSNSVNFITEKDKAVAKIFFSTAWSSVEIVIATLSKIFPKITFEYAFKEETESFLGKVTFKGGKQIRYSENKQTVWKSLRNQYENIYV